MPVSYLELIVAEKPSAAYKIATSFGKVVRKSVNGISYYEVEGPSYTIAVAPAVGHLYGLKKVGERPKYPIFKVQWAPKSEINKRAKYTFNYALMLKRLGSKAKFVTVATDNDIEGEVIGANIVQQLLKKQDANRMVFSTLTTRELQKAYEDRQPCLNWNLANAGVVRHKLDWYFGINLSQALTTAVSKAVNFFKPLSIGRVQGPALSLLVHREKEIQSFVPVPYWKIAAVVTINGKEIILTHSVEKFLTEHEAHEAVKRLQGSGLVVSKVREELKSIIPPFAFDLTTLQMEAHKLFGFSPVYTLQLAQQLYEDALISYPRTSSQKLPRTLGLHNILSKIANQPAYKGLVEQILANHPTKNIAPRDGPESDPAHPAIYSTGEVPSAKFYEKKDQAKLYDLITKRFLSACSQMTCETVNFTVEFVPNGSSSSVTLEEPVKKTRGRPKKTAIPVASSEPLAARSTSAQVDTFTVHGTMVQKEGWHSVYEPYARHYLPVYERRIAQEGEAFTATFAVDSLATKPPYRYSQASLVKTLSDLELGTKGTRAAIVDALASRRYITGNKAITVFPLGMELVQTLESHCPSILSVDLTRKLEKDIENICSGNGLVEQVLAEAERHVTTMYTALTSQSNQIGQDLADTIRFKSSKGTAGTGSSADSQDDTEHESRDADDLDGDLD
eukprot:GILK01006283.1.p1 GENE.GILK01006283.1~~GILK01006283.1.p1  ORF type:complete len:676 (-),score=119.46 GILK01006283.1:87-2114(-)